MDEQPTTEALTEEEKRDRLWATFCHLSALIVFLGIPLGHILGPLVVWLIRRNESLFVDQHGKESLNLQISVTIYAFCLGVVLLVVSVALFVISKVSEHAVFPLVMVFGIGFVALLFLLYFVLVVVASIKANRGSSALYPLTLRLIK